MVRNSLVRRHVSSLRTRCSEKHPGRTDAGFSCRGKTATPIFTSMRTYTRWGHTAPAPGRVPPTPPMWRLLSQELDKVHSVCYCLQAWVSRSTGDRCFGTLPDADLRPQPDGSRRVLATETERMKYTTFRNQMGDRSYLYSQGLCVRVTTEGSRKER